ncbi:MAG TPA: M15 family metallopeptidase [Chloroflexota bacterium]|nr:M15 family metallopeptidase [Chloroflexota bacterium]
MSLRLPPTPRRRSKRRSRGLWRALAFAVLVGLVGVAVAVSSRSSTPKVQDSLATAAASRPAGPPLPSSAARSASGASAASTPRAGFVAASPMAVATCPPDSLLRLVDKDIELPPDYVPPDLVQIAAIDASPDAPEVLKLRKEANDSLHQMLDAARGQGVFLLVQSSYRSYDDQAKVYSDEVRTVGQAQADRESARPGHSEHQLGLAVDFTTRRLNFDLDVAFATTAEGRWLAQNAAQYGWVLSYPDGKEDITGYEYEPWHYRYVGVAVAQAIVQSGQTATEWLRARQAGCQA